MTLERRMSGMAGSTHQKACAGKMDDHFAGARVLPSNGDMLGGQGDDLSLHGELAVIVGSNRDEVAWLAAVGIGGIRHCGRLRRGARGKFERGGGRNVGPPSVADLL